MWSHDERLHKKPCEVKRLLQDLRGRREIEAHLSKRLERGRSMMETGKMVLRCPRQMTPDRGH